MTTRPWNWCHKCRQPVDVDECTDGSERKCIGCDRWFVCVHFTGLDGSESWGLFSESQQKRMTTAMNKRQREAAQ